MRRLIWTLPLIAAALPGQAQESHEDCQQVFNTIITGIIGALDDEIKADEATFADGTCAVSQFEYAVGGNAFRADLITWAGDGLYRIATESLPPYSIDLAIRGGTVLQPPDALSEYLNMDTSAPVTFDTDFSYDWDAETKEMTVSFADLVLDDDSLVEFDIALNGLDLTSLELLQFSAASALIPNLNLRFRNNGGRDYDLMSLFGFSEMPIDRDLSSSFAQLKSDGADVIADFPETVITPDAQTAMTAFLTDLPRPRGDLRVSFQSDPGFGLLRYIIFGVGPGGDDPVAGLWAALEGAEISVTYDQ
jgi:hypothetical protein